MFNCGLISIPIYLFIGEDSGSVPTFDGREEPRSSRRPVLLLRHHGYSQRGAVLCLQVRRQRSAFHPESILPLTYYKMSSVFVCLFAGNAVLTVHHSHERCDLKLHFVGQRNGKDRFSHTTGSYLSKLSERK